MTGAEIAECLGMALSTVSAVLQRIGLGKLCRLEPPEPPNRYERRARRADPHRRQEAGADPRRRRAPRHRQRAQRSQRHAPASARRGWEFVHVCVDDATRLAYVEVLADEKATTAVGFLRRALAFYRLPRDRRRAGDDRQRLAPTAPPLHALACRALGIRHLRTRPYRPRTNGKAERFIRTLLGGWAYGAIYALQPRAHRRPIRLALDSTTTADHTAPSATGRPSLASPS